MGIASSSITANCAIGIQANVFSRAAYYLLPDGQLKKGKILGSRKLYTLHQRTSNPTSNTRLHCKARLRASGLTSARLMVAQEALSNEQRSKLRTPPGTFLPTLLTEDQKRQIGDDIGFKKSYHSLDHMANRKARPQDTIKLDRNDFAVYMAGGGKRVSSIGDAVNGITTMTINSLTAMVCPSSDQDSIKHTFARCVFLLPSLVILGLNGYAQRSIINALDETDKAEIFNGLEVTETVGWYWLMPLFHGVALTGQVIAVAAVDKGRIVDVERVTEAEYEKNETLVKTSNMINAIRNDKAMRTLVIEGLNRRVNRAYKTHNVPDVWLKLENATTPAELQKAIAEYLTTSKPGVNKQNDLLARENQILSVLKLAESDRTVDNGKLDESARLHTERKFGKAHEIIGKFVARKVYKLSDKGKIKGVAKLARWIETHSELKYRERRSEYLKTAEGRIDNRYHPTVVRENGGPLSKALVNIGFFVRDFGRQIVLSLDTNLARVIRSVVKYLWEKMMGSHASMLMCNTLGMIVGWLVVGVALVAISSGLEAAFGAVGVAGMLTTNGAGFGVGFASLTFAYGLFAAAGGVFMLAGMGLARMGL